MKKIFSLFTAILFAGSMMAADELLFSQTYPGSPSEYTNAYTKSFTLTTSGTTLTYANINNGQESNAWTSVRAGRKSDSSVATITSGKIASEISKVSITFTAVNAGKTNELYLLVADNADFDEATKITATIATGEVEFAIASPAENQYYQIVIDQAKHGSSNGFNQFSAVSFYVFKEVAIEAPVIVPNKGAFQTSVEVSITCDTEGAKIYYTLDGTDPTDASTEYTAAFTLTETTTVKCISKKDANVSDVITQEFTFYPTSMTCADAKTAALSVSANNELYAEGLEFTVCGYVTEIAYAYSESSNNMSFWMADAADGDNVIEAYKVIPESAQQVPVVGDFVEVVGSLTRYNTTPEFAANCTCKIIKAPTALDNTAVESKAVKTIKNGQLLIEKDGKFYNVLGTVVR